MERPRLRGLRPQPHLLGWPVMNNSFRPGNPWPDNSGIHINAHGGGILHHDGIFYWYGEHKVAGDAGNRADVGISVYTSTNLYDWSDCGIALSVTDDSTSDIARGCIIERPKVLYCPQTSAFVMWFHLELKGNGYSSARSGVAIASAPLGPFRFVTSFRPNAGYWPANVAAELKIPLSSEEQSQLQDMRLPGCPVPNYPQDLIFRRDFTGGQMARDMTLFHDEDGNAYLIYASEENGTLHIAGLTADFLGTRGPYHRIFPGTFREAPALFKYRGKYYLITSGCTGWSPNAAQAAVADSIFGPWKILGNPCVGTEANVTFNGQSTHVFRVPNCPDTFIFMADRWHPVDAILGLYIWLPLEFEGERPLIRWRDQWDLESLLT
jgi:hypothetical protein